MKNSLDKEGLFAHNFKKYRKKNEVYHRNSLPKSCLKQPAKN